MRKTFKEFITEKVNDALVKDLWKAVETALEEFNADEDNKDQKSFKSQGTKNGVVYYFSGPKGAEDFASDVRHYATKLTGKDIYLRNESSTELDFGSDNGNALIEFPTSSEDDFSYCTVRVF